MTAEDITLPARQAAGGGEAQLALDRQVGRRRAEQPAGVEGSLNRLAGGQGALGQGQVEVDALGAEVLDQQPA